MPRVSLGMGVNMNLATLGVGREKEQIAERRAENGSENGKVNGQEQGVYAGLI